MVTVLVVRGKPREVGEGAAGGLLEKGVLVEETVLVAPNAVHHHIRVVGVAKLVPPTVVVDLGVRVTGVGDGGVDVEPKRFVLQLERTVYCDLQISLCGSPALVVHNVVCHAA